MRCYNKFKYPNRNYIYPFFFYTRIFKFNRPKWKFLKKKISILKNQKKKLLKNIIFKNKYLYLKNINFLKYQIKKKIIFSKLFLNFFKRFKKKFTKKKIKFLQKKIIYKKYLALNKNILLNSFFFDFIGIKSKTYSWKRVKFIFKENLFMKFAVSKYFAGSFSLSFFKRLLFKKNSRNLNISFLFIKPEYRIDVLLWRLNFFSTPYLVRLALRNKKIKIFKNFNSFLNKGDFVNYNFFLKKGDTLKIAFDKTFNLKNNQKKRFRLVYMPSFVEVDYYTNTVVILKNFNDFTSLDLNTTMKEPLCFYKFKNYLSK
jgi:hypothetical protein